MGWADFQNPASERWDGLGVSAKRAPLLGWLSVRQLCCATAPPKGGQEVRERETDREREDLKGTAEISIATSLRSLSEVNAMRQFRI